MTAGVARPRGTRLLPQCGWAPSGHISSENYFGGTGPPEEFVAYLKSVERKFPGLEYVHVSISMGTPQSVMLEQLAWFAKEVKPAFTR